MTSISDSSGKMRSFSSIRVQLAAGFSLIMLTALLIFTANLALFINLERETNRVAETVSAANVLSLELQREFLNARQADANFLRSWRALGFARAQASYVSQNEAFLQQAYTKLAELESLLQAEGIEGITERLPNLPQEIAALRTTLNDYETAFQATVTLIAERSRLDGVESNLRQTLNQLQADTSALLEQELYNLVLQMQVNVVSYLNTQEPQYADNVRLLAGQFRDQVVQRTAVSISEGGPVLDAAALLGQLDTAVALFNDLVRLENEIAINSEVSQEATDEINRLSGSLAEEIQRALTDIQAVLANRRELVTLVSILATIFLVAIGTAGTVALVQRISRPLSTLTLAAQKIANGDLVQTVEADRQDEFGLLAHTFNEMALRLADLVNTLEQRVAVRTRAVEASTEIGRRLATILDTRQLVTEVVNQVQAAFNYYHAHIYLLNEGEQRLEMAGGTGEAGMAMLASGHSLQLTQGLVGRAATQKEAVLVPDVSQEPTWLSNPLLPETKAELAVPILVADQVLGVLDIQQNQVGGLSEEDVRMMQAVAAQVGIALRNARLYEQAQRQAEIQVAINDIGRQIQQAADMETVLQIATRELAQALGAQRASIMISQGVAAKNGRVPSQN